MASITNGIATAITIQNQSRARYETKIKYSTPNGPKNAMTRVASFLVDGPTHSIPVIESSKE
jgi:hypothetical protein